MTALVCESVPEGASQPVGATNRAEVLVEKHRHGATRAIDLVFEGNFTRFSNMAPDDTAPR